MRLQRKIGEILLFLCAIILNEFWVKSKLNYIRNQVDSKRKSTRFEEKINQVDFAALLVGRGVTLEEVSGKRIAEVKV